MAARARRRDAALRGAAAARAGRAARGAAALRRARTSSGGRRRGCCCGCWNRAGDAAASASAGRGDAGCGRSRCARRCSARPRPTTPPRAAIVAGGGRAARRRAGRARGGAVRRPSGRARRCARPIRSRRPRRSRLHTNLALAQAVVMRASHVALRVEGEPAADRAAREVSRAPLQRRRRPRRARRRGSTSPGRSRCSGTRWSTGARSRSWCRTSRGARASSSPRRRALRGRLAQVTMESGDPIFPARAPAPFDSRLEERFAKDVAPPGARLGRDPRAASRCRRARR